MVPGARAGVTSKARKPQNQNRSKREEWPWLIRAARPGMMFHPVAAPYIRP
jgi:hypothetical protein